MLYTFYTLEDFINSMNFVEEETSEMIEKIPGLTADIRTLIGDKHYHIQIWLEHESEDEGIY